MPWYEVPVVYQGQANYLVNAETADLAAEIAQKRFADGQEPDVLGNEWETVERVGEVLEVEIEGTNGA